jgi:hypothetical protein
LDNLKETNKNMINYKEQKLSPQQINKETCRSSTVATTAAESEELLNRISNKSENSRYSEPAEN